MREYVGCKVERRDRDNLIIFQDDLVNKIEKIFGEKVKNMHEYGMPAGSREHIKRPDEGEPILERSEQTVYRRGVGLLLYLVKFSRLDISNAVREFSKVMDEATVGNMKSMLRTIKYVLDTKNRVLSYDTREQEGRKWILKSFSDSDWAGSKDDRRSISGYCIYLNGCLVSWKSRG